MIETHKGDGLVKMGTCSHCNGSGQRIIHEWVPLAWVLGLYLFAFLVAAMLAEIRG